MTTDGARSAQAYLYAYPLVSGVEQALRYATTGVGAVPAAPYNAFGHARRLAGPEDTFVSINNDTVYSMAQVDVGAGPVRLDVPDTAGRYYVLQLVDAWTDNFAYVGRRATGTAAGTYLLVDARWSGDVPDGATVIRFPTRVASIVGRWAVDGEDDLPAVHALQDATTLTPLGDRAATGIPAPEPTGDEALDFWERYRVWSQEFGPAERDRAVQESFAPWGLTGGTPVTRLDAATQQSLRVAYAAGAEALESALRTGSGPTADGWTLPLHVFDYNLDFFEVGTLDDAAWRLTDPTVRLVERAVAARAGLWGNHGYEAAYPIAWVDAAGDPLTGGHAYTLRLSPPPPVDAFWSLTMYAQPDFFLVANPIDRYSIGDRTPGLVVDDDGGVSITMSHERPAGDASNWLPVPPGPFRPILRLYMPRASALDGTYAIPAIERVPGD